MTTSLQRRGSRKLLQQRPGSGSSSVSTASVHDWIDTASRNLKVLARNRDTGIYRVGYSLGVVKGQPLLQHVQFGRNDIQSVHYEDIINYGGASPWAKLHKGNSVFAPKKRNGNEYVPGQILEVPFNDLPENRYYTVGLFNGKKTIQRRRHICLVGDQVYQEAIAYIQKRRREKLPQPKRPSYPPRGRQPKRKPKLDSKTTQTDEVPKPTTESREHGTNTESFLREQNPPPTPPLLNPSRTRQRNRKHKPEIQLDSKITQTDEVPKPTIESREHGTNTDGETFPQPKPPLDPPPRSKTTQTDTVPTIELREDSDKTNTTEAQKIIIDLEYGQEVLARWPDDGWFYYGVVMETVKGQDTAKLKDRTGHVTSIRRDDIIIEEEKTNLNIQKSDYVIALHPNYTYSYAPAKVRRVYMSAVDVKFYDKCACKVSMDQFFKISKAKYAEYVDYIEKCEAMFCNNKAIVLDRENKCYESKTILEVSGPQEFKVQGHSEHRDGQDNSNGQSRNATEIDDTELIQTQKAIHIFPLSLLKIPDEELRRDWEYVLAPVSDNYIYLPAEVQKQSEDAEPTRHTCDFCLKFCDDTVLEVESLDKCFYLNKDYFEFASSVCAETLPQSSEC